jgi:hypothetical protein
MSHIVVWPQHGPRTGKLLRNEGKQLSIFVIWQAQNPQLLLQFLLVLIA